MKPRQVLYIFSRRLLEHVHKAQIHVYIQKSGSISFVVERYGRHPKEWLRPKEYWVMTVAILHSLLIIISTGVCSIKKEDYTSKNYTCRRYHEVTANEICDTSPTLPNSTGYWVLVGLTQGLACVSRFWHLKSKITWFSPRFTFGATLGTQASISLNSLYVFRRGALDRRCWACDWVFDLCALPTQAK